MSATPSKGSGRTLVIVGVVVVIVLAAAGYYLLSGMNSGGTTTSSSSSTTTNSSPLTVSLTIPSGTSSNQALNFAPQSITVVIGVNNTIKWTNDDSATHSITFTSAPAGVSTSSLTDPDNLAAGEVYTLTLTTPGTYQYHCTFHSWMQGTITVVAAA